MILLMKKALYIRWNGCWNEDTACTLMRLSLFSAGISPSITDEILTPDEQLDTPRYMKNIKEMIESLTEKDISVPRRIYGINLSLRGTWGGWC